jgi:hypothetical protein
MVETTRPRISMFMQRFRNLGLTEMSAEHFLIIKENKLSLTSLKSPRELAKRRRKVIVA